MGSYRRVFGLPGPDTEDEGGWPCLIYFIYFLILLGLLIIILTIR